MLLDRPLPLTHVLRQCRSDVLWVLTISAAVEVLVWQQRDLMPEVDVVVPSSIGTAISLLLSFKLAQSYDRWWEARKVWGAIVNDSRTLVRQLLSFAGDGAPLVGHMVHRQIAWCFCLGQSLRGQDWQQGSEGHLRTEDVAEAARHLNKPLALLQQQARDLGELFQRGRLSDYQRVTVDATLTRLTDSMGKAERIRNTVFPTTYRAYLHVFIYIFITLLSVSLGEVQGAVQVLVTTIIAIPFFLLEKTAAHLQDPFSNRPTDTPVTSIARSIETNLLQLIDAGEGLPTEAEPVAPADTFYVM